MAKYLRLHGEIGEGGNTAGAFIAAMESVPTSQPIYISINSPGGSYFDGLAIFNAVARRGNATVIVEGLAASAASLIAMAGKRIIMSTGAMLMVHSPLTTARGNPTEIESVLATLKKIENDMAAIYSRRAHAMSTEEALLLMRAETWLDAETTRTVFRGVEIDAGKIAASIEGEWLRAYRNVPLSLTLSEHTKKTTPAKPEPSSAETAAARARLKRRRKRFALMQLAQSPDPVAANLQRRRARLELGQKLRGFQAAETQRLAAERARAAAERAAAERAQAKARLQQQYYDRWNHVPPRRNG